MFFGPVARCGECVGICWKAQKGNSPASPKLEGVVFFFFFLKIRRNCVYLGFRIWELHKTINFVLSFFFFNNYFGLSVVDFPFAFFGLVGHGESET